MRSSDAHLRIQSVVREFLCRACSVSSTVEEVLSRLGRETWRTAILGGVVRDLYMAPTGTVPRDIDVVVEGASLREIELVLGGIGALRRTRFGGLHLTVQPWSFDIWPVQETWAFRQCLVRPVSLRTLPRTTFLNVEAVAVVFEGCSRVGEVYEQGFIDAAGLRIIDLQLEANPFPELCVVRTISTIERIKFGISSALAEYIVRTVDQVPEERFRRIQIGHYGEVRFTHKTLCAIRDQIVSLLSAGTSKAETSGIAMSSRVRSDGALVVCP